MIIISHLLLLLLILLLLLLHVSGEIHGDGVLILDLALILVSVSWDPFNLTPQTLNEMSR